MERLKLWSVMWHVTKCTEASEFRGKEKTSMIATRDQSLLDATSMIFIELESTLKSKAEYLTIDSITYEGYIEAFLP